MIDRVLVKTYGEPPVDRREILRYSGCRGESAEVEALLDELVSSCKGVFRYQVCYREFPVSFGEETDIGFLKTPSKGLRKHLQNCHKAVVFAATVGIGIDRLIAKYSRLSPTKALLLQAYGAERVEALCDAFQAEIEREEAARNCFIRSRFSPGYGDLPLENQREFVSVLDCSRKIGVSLNDSLLMSPSKSVTAIIGVSKTACREKGETCKNCENRDCAFREGSL